MSEVQEVQTSEAALAVLRSTSTEGLLDAMVQLTHRIHTAEEQARTSRQTPEYAAADLREQRAAIRAEVLARLSAQYDAGREAGWEAGYDAGLDRCPDGDGL